MTGGTSGLYSETYGYNSSTGNLSTKAGVTYAYDANGNMTNRTVGGYASVLNYDAEGRLVSVTGNVPPPTATQTPAPTATRTPTNTPTRTPLPTSTPLKTPIPRNTPTPCRGIHCPMGTPVVPPDSSSLQDVPVMFPASGKVLAMPALNTVSATFMYDGDGKRVAQTVNGVTTYFVGSHYEVTNGVVTKYYFAGGQRIALRKGGTLSYLLADHLGSTSLVTNASGAVISETRYSAWGEVRYQAGTMSTHYTYTGQYSNTADFGLMFYNARWYDPTLLGYDPTLGRFAQTDSLVPSGAQGYDRYAYVNNNPVRYADPSGHKCQPADECDTSHEDYLPTVLDLSKLSEQKGGRTGKSASDLYAYYLSLYSQKDQWWWQAFPKFTIWNFLSLITYNESGYHPESAEVFAEAGVRFFVEWAETRNKSTDVYGVLDWFARFSESAQRLIDTNTVPILRHENAKDVGAMAIVGNSFQNIPEDWAQGWVAERPFNWGNSTVLTTNAAEMYKNNHQAMFVSLPGNNPFYIPSGCAWLSWQQNQNQAACP